MGKKKWPSILEQGKRLLSQSHLGGLLGSAKIQDDLLGPDVQGKELLPRAYCWFCVASFPGSRNEDN